MKRSGFKYDYETLKSRLQAKRQGKKQAPKYGRSQRSVKRLGAGRKTKAWTSERRKLKADSERNNRTTCELRGVVPHECTYDNFLGYAHDAKRRKLSREDLKRAILICTNAHNIIEFWSPEEMKKIVNETIAAREAA